jgi:serine/threonine-protein kinase
MTSRRVLGICSQCGTELSDLSQPCSSCGAAIDDLSQRETIVSPRFADQPFRSSPIGRIDSSSSSAPFATGQVLAGRYRIIGLLGRGGMGEVYRADDLELDAPVSIKVLPASVAQTPRALERFRAEVRNARQIAHPNVCRVYDIGEAQGVHFLTMEFVDGEDLASLLRRIGTLPATKAHEVARQLCAGLAAAHDKGVLHRDLKPSNVMLDGDGRVRITDFGLAVRSDQGATDFSGTPQYMAPEQFAGGPATARTDLYSLGLILYEIYTGRRPFDATSVAEWRSHHTKSTPTLPEGRELQVDESVERAILRCLEKDPSRRPSSARQLAASLPGGDPLAAALAAGETPSPEMVAAAGGEGALSPRAAWLLALGLTVALGSVVGFAPFSSDLGLARMTLSTEVLRDRARGLLDRFGYGTEVVDRASQIERMYPPMLYIAQHEPSTEWRKNWGERGLPAPIVLWMRQSPRWMRVRDPSGRVNRNDPPFDVSGMTLIGLRADGQLNYFRAVPPQQEESSPSAAFDWTALFNASGLDLARFHEVTPTWLPPEASDARAEWVGTAPQLPGIELRVAAAAYRGRPVYFEIFGPWSRPERMVRETQRATQRISAIVGGAIIAVAIVMALVLTRRNRRLGRGDLRGAKRLATFLFAISMLDWLVTAHHVPVIEVEFNSLLAACAFSLLLAVVVAVLYVAIEPYVRRHMPELMIGWARAFEGRLNDPRVGRDVLAGALLGTTSALLLHASNALPTWVPILGQTTVPPSPQMIEGGGLALGALVNHVQVALAAMLVLSFVLFLFRMLLRREWLSLAALMVLLSLAQLGGENVLLETPFAVLQGVLLGWAIGRVGLLAGCVTWFYRVVLSTVPIPIDATTPYTFTTILVIGLMVALAGYALHVSVGSRRLFSIDALEDRAREPA